jgi:hypothetical protein
MNFRRNIDDKTIRWLKPKLVLEPSPIEPWTNRKKYTYVFSLKFEDGYVLPPKGLKQKRPFAYVEGLYTKALWWNYTPNPKTLKEVRRKVADHLETIYWMIKRGSKIVAIRVIVVDWESGQPVSPIYLFEPWYDTETFGGYRLDRKRLLSWGIKIGPSNYVYKETFNPVGKFERSTKLKSSIYIDKAISNIISRIKVNSIYDLKYKTIIKSPNMRREIIDYLNQEANETKFLRNVSHPVTGERYLVNKIEDKILQLI